MRTLSIGRTNVPMSSLSFYNGAESREMLPLLIEGLSQPMKADEAGVSLCGFGSGMVPGDGSGMMRSCKTDMSQILGKVKTVCYFCLS